jgi:hypothetical protein
MRDLEKQIADWRKSMAKATGHRPEALDELELHLRDEIDRLCRAGAAETDAFQTAVSNIGSAAALGAEFEKLTLARRAKWKPVTIAQVLCLGIAVLIAGLLMARIGHGRMTPLLASHVLVVTVGYGTMFIMGGLGICYVLANWFGQTGPTQRYALQRATFQFATLSAVLTLVGIILGMIWAKENWDRYWAWDPKENGGLLVIVCAAATAALRWLKPARFETLAFLTIVGSMLTAWAWFGTAGTVDRDGHRVGTMQFTPFLVALTVAHCMALAAIPLIRLRSAVIARRQ